MKNKILFVLLILLTINIALFAAISQKEAEEIALKDSGIDRDSVTNIFSRKDFEDGKSVYDVVFFDKEGKYEYEIDSSSGAIYDFEYDRDTRRNNHSTASIDKNQALLIALEDAGLSEKDISSKRVKLDRDDGFDIYEVEFKTNDYEYSYDLNADNGLILSGEYEIRGRIKSNRNDSLLSVEDAEMIIRSLVNVNADYVRVRPDYDDGIHIYEADMSAGGIEYEIELNASTGDVISFSWENWSNR